MGLHSSDASAVERIVDDVYGHQQGVLNTASGALSWTTQSYGAYGAFGAELPTLESGSTLGSVGGHVVMFIIAHLLSFGSGKGSNV